jgi:hypothetical protein
MYAMWKYDSFPYKLCGKMVGTIDVEGFIKIERYDSMRFKPIRMFNDKIGKKVCEMLEQITLAKRKEQKELDAKYEEIVAENLLKIAGLQ